MNLHKVEAPGPGSYKLPSSISLKGRHPSAIPRTTFGTQEREFVDLPRDTPAPNKYHVSKFTEASYGYSFAVAKRNNDTQLAKQALLPNPQTYVNKNEMKNQNKYAKTILGGSLEPNEEVKDHVPGPGAYGQPKMYTIPGFRIVQHTNKAKRDGNNISKMEKSRDVGP